MIINGKSFEKHTYIMGILNVTPDSFSDGGKFTSLDAAVAQARRMTAEGAAIIDVGGESTRPGYTRVSVQEEIDRVVPVIEAIRRESDVLISIDTYKSQVAEAALKAGASLVNDVWGFKADEAMAAVTKKYNASCCLMHNRKEAVYSHFLDDVLSDLSESVALAREAGISDDQILTDPGIGFAKSFEQNLFLTKNLSRLNELGLPFLYASSRKSMIGLALDLPVDQRLEGTLATTALAVAAGALFVRVHDVEPNRRLITMLEKIKESGENA